MPPDERLVLVDGVRGGASAFTFSLTSDKAELYISQISAGDLPVKSCCWSQREATNSYGELGKVFNLISSKQKAPPLVVWSKKSPTFLFDYITSGRRVQSTKTAAAPHTPGGSRNKEVNKVDAMTSRMQERKAEAAEFLIDTRRLPRELRWKIQGMVELFDFLNAAKPQDEPAHTGT